MAKFMLLENKAEKKLKNEKWQTALLKSDKWEYYVRKFFIRYIDRQRVRSP